MDGQAKRFWLRKITSGIGTCRHSCSNKHGKRSIAAEGHESGARSLDRPKKEGGGSSDVQEAFRRLSLP